MLIKKYYYFFTFPQNRGKKRSGGIDNGKTENDTRGGGLRGKERLKSRRGGHHVKEIHDQDRANTTSNTVVRHKDVQEEARRIGGKERAKDGRCEEEAIERKAKGSRAHPLAHDLAGVRGDPRVVDRDKRTRKRHKEATQGRGLQTEGRVCEDGSDGG